MIKYEVRVYETGTRDWYLNGKRHRKDGPAIEYANGNKSWYLHGKLHREDGPAIEYINGDKYFYVHGKLHREDGPAVEFHNGTKKWYLNGERLLEKEWRKRVAKNTFNNKVITIDGVKYQLKELR